jgi:hypothetical protein
LLEHSFLISGTTRQSENANKNKNSHEMISPELWGGRYRLDRPSSMARSNTLSNIAAVSRPVFWL